MSITFEELRGQVEGLVQTYQTNPDLIAELLQFKAQFYRYSLRNTMAIKSQNPYATFVDSFLGWRKKGYSVLRGEKGIYIWTPVIQKSFFRSKEEPSVSVSKATLEEKQKIAREEIPVKEKLTFRLGSVFDISQTTCPPEDYPQIYSMGYPDVEHKNLYELLRQFAQKSGFEVNVNNVHSIGLGGFYRPATDEIVLSDKLNDTRQLSVLCHELAHGLMHKTSTQPEAVVEFEAEGLAIMLLTRMGLPVSDQNKRYASNHYRKIDREHYDMDKSFARMQRAYNFVIEGFERELTALAPEETISHKQAMESQRRITENFIKDLR